MLGKPVKNVIPSYIFFFLSLLSQGTRILLIYALTKFSSLLSLSLALWNAPRRYSLKVFFFWLIFMAQIGRARISWTAGWKNVTVSFACVIVTQAVIFGVSCGLNPGAIPVRTRAWGGLTSNPGCQHFALGPRKGTGEGQPWFEPSVFQWILPLLSFGLCYSFPAVPALNFTVALRREQMSTKARIKLPDSFSVGENFNPDLKRGQKSWKAGMLN